MKVYFIENKITKKWAFIEMTDQPRFIHTYDGGRIRRGNELKISWTNDPQKAHQFKSYDEALFNFARCEELENNLIVTEHEFINNEPTI